jgi:uncharacterized protein (TIGR03435 family)
MVKIVRKVTVPVLALTLVVPLWSQTRPAFEVASIKQEDVRLPNGITGGVCHGSDAPGPQVGIPGMVVALGRCRYVGAKVRQLINNAYGGIERIEGGPTWIDSLPFSIDAKAEEGSSPTRPQLQEMLRTLLEDRFKLRFHREMREVPGYALVVGKNGPKMKESAPDARSGASSIQGTIKGSIPMSMLASMLTRAAGGPVIDTTGLTGRFDIELKYTPDPLLQPSTSSPPAPGPATAADPAGASIFTAIQELGLRLEPRKSSVEVFVIDSIEKPDSN